MIGEEYEEMEMPTPCVHCGKIFDLNDGFGSEKWHPNTIICAGCYYKEEAEVEEDQRWEDINLELSNALYILKDEEYLSRVSQDNKKAIIEIALKLSGDWGSQKLIGAARERYDQIQEDGKGEWEGFYNGWLEGRVEMLGEIRNVE